MQVINPPASIGLYAFLADLQGCGHIRIVFPFMLINNFLRIEGYKFYAFYSQQFNNDIMFYKHFSVTIFQRAASLPHYRLMRYFMDHIRAQSKTPIVYEIDDILIDIPKWNFASEFYSGLEDNIKKLMSLVDGISVSTERLKQIYGQYNDNIVVIPNHLPKFLWGDIPEWKESKNKKPRILYSGSQNHFATQRLTGKNIKGGDFGDKLLDFMRKTIDKYQWVIIGGTPDELSDLIKNGKIEFHPFVNILNYSRLVKNLNIDFGIAPLSKIDFNRGKSPIKSLEYSACGFPGVYTNIDPYYGLSLTAETDDDMINHIEQLASDPERRKVAFEKDYNILKEEIFWEEHNNVRKYIESYLSLFDKRLK